MFSLFSSFHLKCVPRKYTSHKSIPFWQKYNYNIFNVWWLTQFSETKAICLSCLKTYYYHSRTTQKSRSELCHFKFIKHTWFDTNIEEQTSWNLHTFLLLFVLLWNFLHSAQVAFKYHKRKLYCTQGTVRESGTDFLSFSARETWRAVLEKRRLWRARYVHITETRPHILQY